MLLTQTQLEDSSRILPEIAKALAALPKPTTPPPNRVAALRAASTTYDTNLLQTLGPPPPTITEMTHTIPSSSFSSDTHTIPLKITRPTSSSHPGPLVILFFSGAFLAGSPTQLTHLARTLASLFSATVICPSYRLAPEHPFPAAVLDAIDAVTWAAEHATGEVLRSDPGKGFVLGGASSGGNLAAVLGRWFLKEDNQGRLGGWRVSALWVGVAQLFDEWGTGVPGELRGRWVSRDMNRDKPILGPRGLEEGERALMRDVGVAEGGELRFPTSVRDGEEVVLRGWPRTYLQVCGMDPLRDDGLVFEEMLRAKSVETRLDFYPGYPHGFWLVVPEEPKAREAVVDVVVGVAWLLGRETGRGAVVGVMNGLEKDVKGLEEGI